MPAYTVLANALLDQRAQLPVTGHHEVRAVCLLQNAGGHFHEILGRFLWFETGHHSHDDLIVRNAPGPQLPAPGFRLDELLNRDRVPAEDPVTTAKHAALLALVGIRVRHDHELGRNFRGDTLQPHIGLADDGALEVIEAEAMSGMKNDRDSGQPGGPASENAGLRAMRMNHLRPFAAKQPPQVHKCH